MLCAEIQTATRYSLCSGFNFRAATHSLITRHSFPGASRIVATMRVYSDPTYSVLVRETGTPSTSNFPVLVTRFYVEISTKFTRNRITISDCNAAHSEDSLNATTALKPRFGYCDNSTFDTRDERIGVTHMQRLSFKKFKFQNTTDVFFQCKIRACARQPCGLCSTNPRRRTVGAGVSGGRRNLQQSFSPKTPAKSEEYYEVGEGYAPPMKLRISEEDENAMEFVVPQENFLQDVPTTGVFSTTTTTSSAVTGLNTSEQSGRSWTAATVHPSGFEQGRGAEDGDSVVSTAGAEDGKESTPPVWVMLCAGFGCVSLLVFLKRRRRGVLRKNRARKDSQGEEIPYEDSYNARVEEQYWVGY